MKMNISESFRQGSVVSVAQREVESLARLKVLRIVAHIQVQPVTTLLPPHVAVFRYRGICFKGLIWNVRGYTHPLR